MPRILLIIDEFQEYFVEDDRVAQNAALLLDRIIRQGRAFGIHVLLGSQTLGGAYTLARATLGQMAVRIALQCSEADSYLILSEDNAAARLLSRPGEAIYNAAAGLEEGNVPFQVVWLSEKEREAALERVRALADEHQAWPAEPAVVFEGNAPADAAANRLLEHALAAPAPTTLPLAPRAWLGAPNAIKGPTEALFRRQSGNNLLIIGQREEAALAIMTVAAVSLGAQCPPGDARFVVMDGTTPDSVLHGYVGKVSDLLPQDVDNVAYADVPGAVHDLAGELKRRQDAGGTGDAAVFLLIYGLQRFRKLRHKEEFGFSLDDDADEGPDPAREFEDLVREGPESGIHVICWCDTLSNVNRAFDRRTMGEFELRILFQMSANDSSNLIDGPAASQLGLHRALFFNEQEGTIEKFRPYSLPDPAWVERVRERLARRRAST